MSTLNWTGTPISANKCGGGPAYWTRRKDPKELILDLLFLEGHSWDWVELGSEDGLLVAGWAEKYPFLFVERTGYVGREAGSGLMIKVVRESACLPSIYKWMAEVGVDPDLESKIVPWLHETHTGETWGYCPYCDARLTHQNWTDHHQGDCVFGVGAEAEISSYGWHKWGDPLYDIKSAADRARERARFMQFGRSLKTSSGTYLLGEPITAPVGTVIQVTGSKENSIYLDKRGLIRLVKPVEIGTRTSSEVFVFGQQQGESHVWGYYIVQDGYGRY